MTVPPTNVGAPAWTGTAATPVGTGGTASVPSGGLAYLPPLSPSQCDCNMGGDNQVGNSMAGWQLCDAGCFAFVGMASTPSSDPLERFDPSIGMRFLRNGQNTRDALKNMPQRSVMGRMLNGRPMLGTMGTANTGVLPWAPALASGLENLALKALGIAGLALSLSGDTPQQQYLNHYTTAQGYLGIMRDQQIQLGPDLNIYVTPDMYSTGAQAQQALQLRIKPIGYFSIPTQNIAPMSLLGPVPGGTGTQIMVDHPISIEGAQWIPLPPEQ